METIRFDRLEILANHLENGKLGNKKFDFNCITDNFNHVKGCGTAGCAIGELPFVFPNDWEFFGNGYVRLINSNNSRSYKVMEFFEIKYSMEKHLFYPNFQSPELYGGKMLGYDATKEEVAANIREFIQKMRNDNK